MKKCNSNAIILLSILYSFISLSAKANAYNKRYYHLFDTVKVINAGIGGNTSRDLLNRLQKDCLSHTPDLTVLMIGTNDMVKDTFTIERYKNNLLTLVDSIQQCGSKILLMTILPFYKPYLLRRHPVKLFLPDGPDKRRDGINNIIKQAALDKNTYLLDIGNIFKNVGEIGEGKRSLIRNQQNSSNSDGVHPVSAGYRLIAVAIAQFITDHNLNPQVVVCFGDSITKGVGSEDKKGYPDFLSTLLNNF